ncbi:cell division FtsZ family protein [Verrucomicrobiaceae bacterium R5-34]|uniref:Cell division protein FtsZ n=1 Tax=Oceaniferula flava TaxID=2800421 RepID=A0AAE2VBT3_9BACT|nr:cell division protein FtsZ [Oceaniferula flavus]MBK1831545.1 cell division FtsZ family protein [Verrucomicrobiaceae bacterium R5-34]MBK1854216.1 cell division FtsZ family protein [Oceaniferula flavus]MBM1135522.1 cell division FtsZ family protein [Oceaniferula flavus]
MISYERDPQQTIPESSVKIIGLGGAGGNMLDRAALDGMTGAEMLCVNTDMRTLASSVAGDKIQIGRNLTKGLGAGGDPELGLKAAQESEQEIRDALRDRKMVFLCVGLGGGTGSGAAPLICRIAREEGAFVVVFATMPFSFEGARRRDQAETALNELAVLSNALVTFDNGRMGELVLAKQGIHEAFAAADRMISESIKAVTRLVVRPGLINVGLDDLMTALNTTRSRCLFGSGIATGENRSQAALENSLTSPLLDKGSLLGDATTVLVHICGGESLTLYEVELLMQGLAKHVPSTAHILFGAAVDPSMGDSLSVTLVSALPENKLNPESQSVSEQKCPTEPVSQSDEEKAVAAAVAAASLIDTSEDEEIMEPSEGFSPAEEEPEAEVEMSEDPFFAAPIKPSNPFAEADDEEDYDEAADVPVIGDVFEKEEKEVASVEPVEELEPVSDPSQETEEVAEFEALDDLEDLNGADESAPQDEVFSGMEPINEEPISQMPPKRPGKTPAQPELELDGGPKGKFEGESPNFHEGEDLDIPPFLRKRRR